MLKNFILTLCIILYSFIAQADDTYTFMVAKSGKGEWCYIVYENGTYMEVFTKLTLIEGPTLSFEHPISHKQCIATPRKLSEAKPEVKKPASKPVTRTPLKRAGSRLVLDNRDFTLERKPDQTLKKTKSNAGEDPYKDLVFKKPAPIDPANRLPVAFPRSIRIKVCNGDNYRFVSEFDQLKPIQRKHPKTQQDLTFWPQTSCSLEVFKQMLASETAFHPSSCFTFESVAIEDQDIKLLLEKYAASIAELTVHDCMMLTNEAYEEIAANQLPKLRKLSITAGTAALPESFLAEFTRSCPALQHLEIRFHSTLEKLEHTNTWMKKCPNIRVFELYGPSHLQLTDAQMIVFLKAHTQLQRLMSNMGYKLGALTVECICLFNTNLTEIFLPWCRFNENQIFRLLKHTKNGGICFREIETFTQNKFIKSQRKSPSPALLRKVHKHDQVTTYIAYGFRPETPKEIKTWALHSFWEGYMKKIACIDHTYSEEEPGTPPISYDDE